MSYEEDHLMIKKLTEENQILRRQISDCQHCCKPTPSDSSILAENAVAEARELMDDFYIIAQETPPADTQSKRFRDIIRNFSSGLPASPILGRRQSHVQSTNKPLTEEAATAGKVSVSRSKAKSSASQTSASSLPQQTKVLADVEASQSKNVTNPQQKQVAISKSGADTLSKDKSGLLQTSKERCEVVDDATRNEKASSSKAPFILLSQDTYGEHQSAITHCKFNSSGSVMASSDVSGIIKIWSISPSPQTLATVMSKSSVTAVDWASKLERLLLSGNKLGAVRLYDTKEKRTLSEIVLGPEQQIRCLKCNPIDSTFVCCTVGQLQVQMGSDSAQAPSTEGRVVICDMKTMKLEKTLGLVTFSAVNSCVYNHNGQLLLLGSKDGKIQLIDMISHECIATWVGHQGSVYQVEFSPDETSCYSIGEDGKFIQWNVNATGKMMSSTNLHDKAVGPFESPEGMGLHDSLFHPVGKLFALDSEGRHVLTCSGNGGMVYLVPSCGSLQPIMTLGGHRAAVTTVDWFSAVDCGMCISASIDGKIKISTILAQ